MGRGSTYDEIRAVANIFHAVFIKDLRCNSQRRAESCGQCRAILERLFLYVQDIDKEFRIAERKRQGADVRR